MEKLLYIDCCIRKGNSRSRLLAERFLQSVEGAYEIKTLNLMEEAMPYLMDSFFEQREQLLAKKNYEHPRFRYAHEFAQVDKVVVAAPFWDLSFPALLKVYIENLCVEGITFGANATGCFGLCKATDLVFLTTRGGTYEGSHMEMGSRYMEAMCEFFGIANYHCVAAEGLDLGIRPVAEIMEEAYVKIEQIAKQLKS